jgi:amino acid transporter, AAT family
MTPRHLAAPDATISSELGLSRRLSSAQQTMMAIGGAFGTGLFLASGLAVKVAGPAVILSYVLVAGVAILLGRALAEMAVAHPTAGSFGVYAGMYLSPFAGYAVRLSYWLMEVIATGVQLVAAALYMRFWLPEVPSAAWVLGFAFALLYLNSREVGRLGAIEYWFAMIKVAAMVVFAGLAALVLFGATGEPAIGAANLTGHGGFMPFGLTGVWLGCCPVIFSFIGVEIIGVTSGEAADPGRTIPAAMRRMVFGLSAIYIVAITLLTALAPWDRMGDQESPFVTVLVKLGIPAAASVMNFVVLSAALSSANANLYLISRTVFSLARAGFVPAGLGKVSSRGAPVNAMMVSSVGLAAAVVVVAVWPSWAYTWLFGVALFGALFVWLMIFVTHIAFRGRRGALGSYVGAAMIAGILISTWWANMRSTLLAGGPWLAVLALGYYLSSRRRA